MSDRIALLLRGVNVGGHNKVPMRRLTELATAAGATDVSTYLQSGNIALTPPAAGFAAVLRAAIADDLGLDIDIFEFTGAELAAVLAYNPFPERAAEPKQLHVAFLAEQPTAKQAAVLEAADGPDRLSIGRRAIYLSYAGSSHDSKLAAVLRTSRVNFTARNWTTVLKLVELTS